MIKVQIVYSANAIKSITLKGHAGSGEYGHDLVCAAVSAVITGGANALENIEVFDIKLESGSAKIEAIGEVSSHDEVVLETIVTGLKTIEESNKNFIEIKEIL